MFELEAMLARYAIEKELIKFARGMDSRDWAGLKAILTEDATADYGQGLLQGPDAVVGVIRSYLEICGPTQHLLGNLLVEWNGERDGASAISHCYVSDMHLGAGANAHLTFCTLGDYQDRWKLIDGRWRLAGRRKDNRGHFGTLEVFAKPA
jgi:SnoaL-like domain